MRPLIEDFPSQFKGKPKIEALCACFDRQFAEIEQCFQQLLFLLDIEKEEGEQLDRIGDIVVLSRAEAGLLAAQGGVIDFDVIDDARYRKYLKYKILANTSNTTYRDIITAVKTIWDVDKVSYNENTDGPASLTVSFPYEYKPGRISFCCRLWLLPESASISARKQPSTPIAHRCGLPLFRRQSCRGGSGRRALSQLVTQ